MKFGILACGPMAETFADTLRQLKRGRMLRGSFTYAGAGGKIRGKIRISEGLRKL